MLHLGTRLWLNKTHSAWLLLQTWSWLYMTRWCEYILATVGDCQIFERAPKYAAKCHTFRTRKIQATHALMSCKNSNEWNLSIEKPFHSFEVKSSCLSVNNKMKHCVSSALVLKYTPIKNLLSRVHEPPDPFTRVHVGLGVLSPSLVSLKKVFPTISQLSQL